MPEWSFFGIFPVNPTHSTKRWWPKEANADSEAIAGSSDVQTPVAVASKLANIPPNARSNLGLTCKVFYVQSLASTTTYNMCPRPARLSGGGHPHSKHSARTPRWPVDLTSSANERAWGLLIATVKYGPVEKTGGIKIRL